MELIKKGKIRNVIYRICILCDMKKDEYKTMKVVNNDFLLKNIKVPEEMREKIFEINTAAIP